MLEPDIFGAVFFLRRRLTLTCFFVPLSHGGIAARRSTLVRLRIVPHVSSFPLRKRGKVRDSSVRPYIG